MSQILQRRFIPPNVLSLLDSFCFPQELLITLQESNTMSTLDISIFYWAQEEPTKQNVNKQQKQTHPLLFATFVFLETSKAPRPKPQGLLFGCLACWSGIIGPHSHLDPSLVGQHLPSSLHQGSAWQQQRHQLHPRRGSKPGSWASSSILAKLVGWLVGVCDGLHTFGGKKSQLYQGKTSNYGDHVRVGLFPLQHGHSWLINDGLITTS